MIVKNKDQRVAVLVDVQNLYYSARNLYGARISFKNLLDIALAGRVLTRAIAYVIKSDVTNGEGDFFSAVHDAGFEVKEKELQIFPGGAKKGDWDLGIAMDAIRLGNKVDSIVLVSGDGDYVPVVSYLQQSLGCLVEVVAFDKTCSKALREVADDFIAVETYTDELLFKTEKSKRTAVVSQRSAEATRRSTGGRVSRPMASSVRQIPMPTIGQTRRPAMEQTRRPMVQQSRRPIVGRIQRPAVQSPQRSAQETEQRPEENSRRQERPTENDE